MDDRGILRRVFTQNVDGLYQKTGLSEDMLVEYHGNYANGTMVLYGDPIPAQAKQQAVEDLVDNIDTDLLIIMGSSLQVMPFCILPNLVSKECTRILVDRQPENAMSNPWSKQPRIIDGMYSIPGGGDSSVKFGGRRVTLRPLFRNNKKYPQQYVYTADCDSWANALMTYFL